MYSDLLLYQADARHAQGNWMGTLGIPQAGTSYGRPSQYVMGTSPYGKSIDMVDVCTKLMEGR